MIKPVGFDLDSVLIQSEDLWTNAREAFLREQGDGGARECWPGHDGHEFYRMGPATYTTRSAYRFHRNEFLRR
jgi:hypothetical protein